LYHSFYNLKEQPFRLTPDPAFMYMTTHHQEALAGLVYSVCTRPGLTVLTGEAGTGKTTLLYALLDLLEKRRFITALCTNPVLSREELFDFLMTTFATNCSSPLKSRQLAALQETLLRNRMEGRPSVLIVDEAQRLSMELLEEVRLLLNMETPREKLLQIIIAGQPELGDILQRPELRQFKQRISCQCTLRALTFDEVREYIDHRMTQAGLPNQALFSGTVIQRIYEYSEGIPRLVSSICDAALQNGFATHAPHITVPIVDEVARDLNLKRLVPRGLEPLEPLEPVLVAPPPPSLRQTNGHAADFSEVARQGTGHRSSESRVPMESYASRQKTLGFFAQLMDRWK
jgi:general secretion pathway protein A